MKDPSPNYETLSPSSSAVTAVFTLVALPSAKASFPASDALELSELVLLLLLFPNMEGLECRAHNPCTCEGLSTLPKVLTVLLPAASFGCYASKLLLLDLVQCWGCRKAFLFTV